MANRDHILNELKELDSSLASIYPETIFRVPAGYFDQLNASIMKRVKAGEAANARKEITILSPLLSKLPVNPFTVPVGYFEELQTRLQNIMLPANTQTAEEELHELSPLLAGLKKQPTYEIPAGYFEKPIRREEVGIKQTKVISLTSRKWFRYAAAAVLVGVVATFALIFLGKSNNVDPSDKSYAWVKKNMKKVSTDDITEFVELAGAGAVDVVKTEKKDEIMTTLLKDVSDKEIQEFLNDTQDAQADAELLLN